MMRHRWSAPSRTEHDTNRTCERCGLIRVTRHEPNALPWTEWYRDGQRVPAAKTPACEAVAAEVAG